MLNEKKNITAIEFWMYFRKSRNLSSDTLWGKCHFDSWILTHMLLSKTVEENKFWLEFEKTAFKSHYKTKNDKRQKVVDIKNW
jgi:hypothetical protein